MSPTLVDIHTARDVDSFCLNSTTNRTFFHRILNEMSVKNPFHDAKLGRLHHPSACSHFGVCVTNGCGPGAQMYQVLREMLTEVLLLVVFASTALSRPADHCAEATSVGVVATGVVRYAF